MLLALREQVYQANLELVRHGLVVFTFGNVSGCDREAGLVVIKPSGVPYDQLRPDDLVVTDLAGNAVEGKLRPSSDLATHLVLYRSFPGIGGVAHTHSRFATAWAQARRDIPCLGTTHADYFRGPIPITEPLAADEISGSYEENTGLAIVRRLRDLDPAQIPGALVAGHGPFCWGPTAAGAAHLAVLVEEIAALAHLTISLNPGAPDLSEAQRDQHFDRKHGSGAYYGQNTQR